MPNQASERLIKLNDKIMHCWEERALVEVEASVHQQSLALRDSLPEFLNQLADALSTTINRTSARVKWDKAESTRVGKKHGKERAGMFSYTMDQLILEYHILRQTICDVMEEEAPLSDIEREVIVCAVEQSVNDAATQFSDTLRDIQERLTQTLAHDLRGPLSAAKMNSQIFLKNPSDTEKGVLAVTRISSAMDRIDIMITDLLDAGKLRAGQKLVVDTQECDLEAILKQVVDEANFIHENRVSFKSTGPELGMWNADGLRRVFDNLVMNAVKFSDPHTPITIQLQKSSKNIKVCVHNIGKPIASEELPYLFEQYRRARTSKDKKGWGLGLVVVKGVTEAHGGHVEVESTREDGTVFRVVLPIKH